MFFEKNISLTTLPFLVVNFNDMCITLAFLKFSGCGGKPEWIKDGFCDDRNNNEGCDFDGGDCCGHASVNKRFCRECKCTPQR